VDGSRDEVGIIAPSGRFSLENLRQSYALKYIQRRVYCSIGGGGGRYLAEGRMFIVQFFDVNENVTVPMADRICGCLCSLEFTTTSRDLFDFDIR